MIYLAIAFIIAVVGGGIFIYVVEKKRDWRTDLKYAKIYLVWCGVGLNIYWLYLLVTNI